MSTERIWKTIYIQKPAAADVMIEALFMRPNRKERFIVLQLVRSTEGLDPLEYFVAKLRDTFVAGSASNPVVERTKRMGFAGRELHFRSVEPDVTFDCELFAFSDKERCWAVLHAKPVGEPAAGFSSFAFFKKRPAATPGVVALQTFRVVEPAISDFPIGFKVSVHPGTTTIAQMIVSDVPADSSTEAAGVKVGDEIVSIDGRLTTTFSADSGKNSELGQIFLNRRWRDEVTLELISAETHTHFTVVLTVQNYGGRLHR